MKNMKKPNKNGKLTEYAGPPTTVRIRPIFLDRINEIKEKTGRDISKTVNALLGFALTHGGAEEILRFENPLTAVAAPKAGEDSR
jgi:hypothetical protein